jgi:hypothetical protein
MINIGMAIKGVSLNFDTMAKSAGNFAKQAITEPKQGLHSP